MLIRCKCMTLANTKQLWCKMKATLPCKHSLTYNQKNGDGNATKNFMMVMQQKPQQCSTSCSQQSPQQKRSKHVDKKKGSLKNIKYEGKGKGIEKQEEKKS